MKKVSLSSDWREEEILLHSSPKPTRAQLDFLHKTFEMQVNGDSIMTGLRRDTLVVLTASTPEGKTRLTPGELYRSADCVIGIERTKGENLPDEITLHNSLTGKSRTMRWKGRPELQNIPVKTTSPKMEVFQVQDFAELEKRVAQLQDTQEVQDALTLPKDHPARFATLYGGFV